jgi:hypothetical protein
MKESDDTGTAHGEPPGGEPLHDVLIIVERASQLTGSGCCGKLEGDRAFHGGRPVFEESRRDQEAAGSLFRLFCELGSRWQTEIVDPRNMLALWPLLWKQVRRHRPPPFTAARTLSLAFSAPALILDGRVVTSRRLPSREWLESYVERLTERPLPITDRHDGTPSASAGE